MKIDQWMTGIDKGDLVGTLFIDFRKAFEMVDHSLLTLKSLDYYKLSSTYFNWFKSYLNTRLQNIKSNHGLSDFSQLLSGVPQSSILGQTLFFLLIIDLPPYLQHCSTDLYAGESTDHASGKSKVEIEYKLQSDADGTDNSSRPNKLPIHYSKSMRMALGSRHKIQKAGKLNITIGDTSIKMFTSIHWWNP